MAVPLYTASPINTNVPLSAFPSSPSTFAMRYTPAEALDEVLATSVPLPPSKPVTPSPEAMQNTQRANTLAHTSNAFPTSPTPMKAQPSQATNFTTPAYSTHSHNSSGTSSPQPPSLTRLSIPSTPSSSPKLPTAIPYTGASAMGSPVSRVSSTYSPPHLPHHARNISSISAISGFSSPYLSTPIAHAVPTTPGNNPPGYVQNTRDSFEDRPLADVEEQTYSLPRSPLRQSYSALHNSGVHSPFYAPPSSNDVFGHRHRKSYAGGPGILNGEIFFQNLDGVNHEGTDGGDENVWEVAGKWAKMGWRKLGEAEEGVWRVVSGER
ncbi:uncharacterized protein AB675_8679 [Cyphellophora attinorum]|uniref:Uncharacterized protein n=1 Tax=Cyphellophora attinorum TaxID=1664694 RepID=A0A0N0NR68_9EURO|nr:uncharacterized protein AB675_8679 [Phialophora attinorum]KPI44738.1 hypothetical protein AB675_8679 [Phialophora attinorum]